MADDSDDAARRALLASVGPRLAAYAVPVVGTVPGTPAGAVAGRAVVDAIAVAVARAAEAPNEPALRTAWQLALVRTECLRQLRARNLFADDPADVWVAADALDDDDALVAAAFLGLSPRQRDLLALGWVADLPADALARITAGGTAEGYATRLSAARDALAAAAGATALVVRPKGCAGLDAVLVPRYEGSEAEAEDAPDNPPAPRPLSPALRALVSEHARRCERCRPRRQSFLATALPGFRLPAERPVPAALEAPPGAVDPVARFGGLRPDGFPDPLEADDVAPRRWLRLAVAAAAASAALLLLGTIALLASGR